MLPAAEALAPQLLADGPHARGVVVQGKVQVVVVGLEIEAECLKLLKRQIYGPDRGDRAMALRYTRPAAPDTRMNLTPRNQRRAPHLRQRPAVIERRVAQIPPLLGCAR
jgi:hypothetical protein